MPFDVSQVPLKFDNERKLKQDNGCGLILLWSAVSVSAVANLITLLAMGFQFAKPQWWVVLALPWAMPGGVLLLSFVGGMIPSDNSPPGLGSFEKSTLEVDEDGIHIRRGSRDWNYPWPDILSANRKDVYPPGQRFAVPVIQIRLKGQLLADKYDNLIDSTFNISLDDLHALILQGIERWGGGQSVENSGPNGDQSDLP